MPFCSYKADLGQPSQSQEYYTLVIEDTSLAQSCCDISYITPVIIGNAWRWRACRVMCPSLWFAAWVVLSMLSDTAEASCPLSAPPLSAVTIVSAQGVDFSHSWPTQLHQCKLWCRCGLRLKSKKTMMTILFPSISLHLPFTPHQYFPSQ